MASGGATSSSPTGPQTGDAAKAAAEAAARVAANVAHANVTAGLSNSSVTTAPLGGLFTSRIDLTGLPEQFTGRNFKRWSSRMKMWLCTRSLYLVVVTEPPKPTETDPKEVEMAFFKEKDMWAKCAILAALTDELYDVFNVEHHTAKNVWDDLKLKYNTDNLGLEKYSVSRYLNYRMVEGKPVTEQVQALNHIFHELAEAGMELPEPFRVMSIIEKLPRSWSNFGLQLKHQTGQLPMNQLMISVTVEEQHRQQHQQLPVEARANLTLAEKKQNKRGGVNPASRKIKKNQGKEPVKANNKPCWNCGKTGHYKNDCPKKRVVARNPQANVVTGGSGSQAVTPGTTPDLSRYTTLKPVVLTIYEPLEWLVDTGANVHICADKSLFKSYQAVHGRCVKMGDASDAQVLGIGNIKLKFPSDSSIELVNVHHVPAIRRNIISCSELVKLGFEFSFKHFKVVILYRSSFVGKGYLSDGLFKLQAECIPFKNEMNLFDYCSTTCPIANLIESACIWHSRLGHVNYDSIKRMMNLGLIPSHTIDRNSKCQICVEAKLSRKPYHSVERDSEILDLVHTDICEFNGVLTRNHKRYFITFIDDCSKYCYVYLLCNKDEALEKFDIFRNEIENQTGRKIKRLRSDRGGEYFSGLFVEYCQTNGIIHEETPPYSPQSNGVAERKNRTFKDMINSLLLTSGLPKYLWGEALNIACHILNRVPLKHKERTPFEVLKSRKPSLKYFRVWGCLAKVMIPEHKRKKLGPKTVDTVFLGYVETSYAMRFLVIKSEIPGVDVNTIIEYREAIFFENVFPMKTGIPQESTSSDLDSTFESIPEYVENVSNVGGNPIGYESIQEESDEPRRSKRARVIKNFGSDYITFNIEDEPSNFKQAMSSCEAKHWNSAIKSEMDSIVANGTWELVNLPPGCNTIGCKWVFKKKLKADGTIDKYKARLVAKGFKQKEGIDYFDTYSPVARLTTIRVLIALASIRGFIIHQMDVKTAFLHGNLEEEIYMDQPEGFVAPGNENKVCKLVKSLYGLKQAPKQWHEKFDVTILSFGFIMSESDKCVYHKTKSDAYITLCLYVDDILMFGSNLQIITETKSFLHSKFDMKDMGEASLVLGLKLTKSTSGITISQSHYIEKNILERYGYQNAKAVKTPYNPAMPLFKNRSGVPICQLRYSQMIGSLQYLANGTRPDISFAVSKLARYTSCPDKTHWKALDRVLCYLKGTISLGLHYEKFPNLLEGYSDASWIAMNSGCNGCTGYVFTLAGGAVAWRSCKQTLITRSTFEAELCALDTTGSEAEWLYGLMSDIPFVSKPIPPISVHCDNLTTITKISSTKYNEKTKRHIQLRLKSIRGLVSERIIAIDFIGSKDNVADPLTKGLEHRQVLKLRMGMGLRTQIESPTVATQPTRVEIP